MSQHSLPKPLAITSWVLQIAVAGVFVMMSINKLTGNADARWIFQQVGLGDAGMYATGVAELLSAILLLVPKTTIYGAILSILVVLGAIGSHLTKLGISVPLPSLKGDKDPSMFIMAVGVLVVSCVILFLRRSELPIGKKNTP